MWLKIMLTKNKLNKLAKNFLLSIAGVCSICINVNAVILNPASLADCYLPHRIPLVPLAQYT